MKVRKYFRDCREAGLKTFVRNMVFGRREKDIGLAKLLIYFILIIIGFIYLYPLLLMLSTSFKSLDDLINDAVKWIPSELYLENYKQALKVMDFSETLWQTVALAVIPSLLQVICCCLTGYAISRYRFPGKSAVVAMLILTFVLPKQATMLPTYLLFKQYKIVGTIHAFTLPAALGQGLSAAIITLVFFQFFNQINTSVIEAAQIDGCGHFRVFFHIALPSVGAAFIIGFLFSLVWYWNETYLTALFVSNTGLGNTQSMTTLLMELRGFEASYKLLYQGNEAANKLNEAIRMAGTVLCILPLLAVYFVLQRYFVQSVDMVGIKE